MPDRTEIAARFREIVGRIDSSRKLEITDNARFVDDLRMDSLDVVELLIWTEKDFGIEIPDSDAEALLTVDAAVTYIERRLAR